MPRRLLTGPSPYPVKDMEFTVRGGRIVAIGILADPARLETLDVTGWETED
ncbi:hypothetical protein ACFWHQ_31675 [Streptomyces sp. NPDC060334]|uniref:hypothetical protein n=1 Tax=unclassified Streptomyces TaxID=2593676 RepID=UPI003324C3EB